jgi:hypothetical protein
LTDTTDFVSHLRRMAATPRDGHDAEWLDFVTKALGMPGCYVPAAQAVIDQGRWRRVATPGHNPIGYIKTATYREALKLGLALDRYLSDEPFVRTKDRPERIEREDPVEELRFDHRDSRRGCVPLRFPNNKFDQSVIEARIQRAHNDAGGYDCVARMRCIPRWLLKRGASRDAVDWERVASYAVKKPRMTPAVARVLALRFDRRIGLPAAMADAAIRADAKDIEAARKWVDRNHDARIAPLFRMAEPPKTKATSREPVSPDPTAFIPAPEALRQTLSKHQEVFL